MSETPTIRYVLLADVVSSREIDNRAQFQSELQAALETVNSEFEGSIDTPFETLKGIDEFGAILTHISPVYEMVTTILNRIFPVKLRLSIARGKIDVGTDADSLAEMDGPAFHRADQLLQATKADDMYITVDTGSDQRDGLLSNTINLLLIRRESYTAHQVDVLRAYEKLGSQSAVANTLEITQQSVSKTLQRIDYNRTKRIRTMLEDSLTADAE